MSQVRTLAALSLVSLLALPVVAEAGALFGSRALALLTLVAVDGGGTIPDGVSINYETSLVALEVDRFGAATANADATLQPGAVPIPMAIGDTLRQDLLLSGQAGERNGRGSALVNSDGRIRIDNLSAASIVLSFDYEVQGAVAAYITGGGIDAGAAMEWYLADELGQLILDGSIFADALFGPDADQLDMIGSFDLMLEAGGTNVMSSLLDADGYADAPLPPTWTLLIAGIGLWRRLPRPSRSPGQRG